MGYGASAFDRSDSVGRWLEPQAGPGIIPVRGAHRFCRGSGSGRAESHLDGMQALQNVLEATKRRYFEGGNRPRARFWAGFGHIGECPPFQASVKRRFL